MTSTPHTYTHDNVKGDTGDVVAFLLVNVEACQLEMNRQFLNARMERRERMRRDKEQERYIGSKETDYIRYIHNPSNLPFNVPSNRGKIYTGLKLSLNRAVIWMVTGFVLPTVQNYVNYI